MRPLRIFCAIEKEPFAGSRLWYNNILDALIDLGHDVVVFDYDIDPFYRHADLRQPENQKWVAANRPHLEEALLSQVTLAHQSKPLDLVFTYFYDAHCTPQVIEKIKNQNILTYNWYCNASYQLNLVTMLAPAYDFCLVPEEFRLDDYQRLGARPIYCQEAANPNFYKKMNLEKDLGVVFIGQNYADRLTNVAALEQADLPVEVWGHHWAIQPEAKVKLWAKQILGRTVRKPLASHRIHAPCTDKEMVKIYNRAKIALGFGIVASEQFNEKPIFQIRLRDFEAPMCGTFYLTQHQDELEDFFKVGQEIETFHSREELIDKTKFYLKHDDVRERIALGGYDRARRDHTWQKRLAHVFTSTLTETPMKSPR